MEAKFSAAILAACVISAPCLAQRVQFHGFPEAGAEQPSREKAERKKREKGDKTTNAKKADKPRVGDLGEAHSLSFLGLESFTPEQIRDALQNDLVYQAAARPSADWGRFILVLRDRIEQGYAHAGIRARVNVTLADSVVVEVEEQGKTICRNLGIREGANLPERLAGRVREKVERGWTYRTPLGTEISSTELKGWEPGEPLAADLGSLKLMSQHIFACYADFGLLITPEECLAMLRRGPDIELTDHGVTAGLRISSIEINGLTRHSREEILELIEVTEGDPLNREILEKIGERLAESHRFWTQKVVVQLPPPPDRYGVGGADARLAIELLEYEEVPKLGEALTEVDLVMLRTADWMRRLNQETSDYVVDQTAEGFDARAVFSPSRGSFLVTAKWEQRVADSTLITGDHALIVSPEDLSIYSWPSFSGLRVPREINPFLNLKLLPAVDDQGDPVTDFSLSFGVESGHQKELTRPETSPEVWVRSGRLFRERSLDNGVLTLVGDPTVLKIEASTGKVLSIESHWNGAKVVATARQGEYQRQAAAVRERATWLPDRWRTGRPVPSLLAFLIDELHDQFQRSGGSAENIELLLQLKAAIQSPVFVELAEGYFDLKKDSDSNADHPRFEIPRPFKDSQGETLSTAKSRSGLVPMANQAFDRGTWPWTLMREVALLPRERKMGQSNYRRVEREFDRLIKRPDTGPIYALVMAKWFSTQRGVGPHFARWGLDRLDEDYLKADLAHFTEGDLTGAELVEKLSEFAAHLDSRHHALVLRYTPEIAKRPVAALLKRRAEDPGEPPREAVVNAVVGAWDDGWRDEVEAELRRSAGAPAVANEAEPALR